MRIYAAVHLPISVPGLLLALPRNPAAKSSEDAYTAETGGGIGNRHEMLLLTLIFITGSAIFSILSIHLRTFLQALGFALAGAVALGTLVGPSQVGARLIEIAFGARYHPIWTLVTAAALICLGIALLYLGFVMPAACLILYGAGNGIWSISRGTVPLSLFGAADYPRVMGRLAKSAFLAQAVAPLLAALAISRYGEHIALLGVAALAGTNLALVVTLICRSRSPRLA